MQRIRIAYDKGAELQYTGNLDMHKVWERTFRRANLSLAYSQGFHPQPKLQQAAPLPLGFISHAEILDVWMDTDEPIDDIARKIVATVQPGISVREVKVVPLLSEPLPNLVTAAEYLITCDEVMDPVILNEKIAALLARDKIERERRSKPYDLRPLIQSLTLENSAPTLLRMCLSSLPGATGRPEEVLEELFIDPYTVDIVRTRLVLNNH
jgi:radical SAM-linked protein